MAALRQFSYRRISSHIVHRFNYISHPPLQQIQCNHFAYAKQRPKSIVSLSNPHRKRTTKDPSDETALTDWKHYDIQLFQYFHDPRSSQFRTLLDYLNIPYNCIEVTPFNKEELSLYQIPEQYHSAPLLRMAHRSKLKETIETYKAQAVEYIPNGYRHEALQIANVLTFRDRIKEYINKNEAKTEEEKDSAKTKIDELFEYYDDMCLNRYNYFFHHKDLHSQFLPFLESNLSNDQCRRFFNEKCDKEKVEFYSQMYAWVLQAASVKSFHSCFQLMSYVKMFRKTRKWSRFKAERTHLFAAIKMRVLHKRKYCKRAMTANQPKGRAMKLTYEFLQTFNVGMADLIGDGKVPKPKEDSEEDNRPNTRADISLIGKPFHGGRNPDILDILVYGALKGTQGLDVYNHLFRKATQINDWYTKMQDEVGSSSCQKHI